MPVTSPIVTTTAVSNTSLASTSPAPTPTPAPPLVSTPASTTTSTPTLVPALNPTLALTSTPVPASTPALAQTSALTTYAPVVTVTTHSQFIENQLQSHRYNINNSTGLISFFILFLLHDLIKITIGTAALPFQTRYPEPKQYLKLVNTKKKKSEYIFDFVYGYH